MARRANQGEGTMSHSVTQSRWNSSEWRLSVALALLICLCYIGPASAQVVAQYGFEDATAQGWASFNGASAPAATTVAAHSGTQSLLTTTNSSGAGGPGIQLQLTNLVPGATYQITGFVMLATGADSHECKSDRAPR